MLLTILVVILVLAMLGMLPVFPHAANFGYWPSGLILLIVLVIVLYSLKTGREWW
jgi:hypothetical protein